jgi:intracellular sulfur oxidation DsrE/DsrF family protein
MLIQWFAAAICMSMLPAQASDVDPISKPFAEHKLVLQLSDDDEQKHQSVLDVASNVTKHYGQDMVDIEIVAFGPGLKLLFKNGEHADRVTRLAEDTGVRFNACGNTLQTIKKKTGKEPALNPVSQRVTTGVARIMDLVEQGYVLVRP